MARIWVVATTGSATGLGSSSDPRTLESLIAAGSPVAAGDKVLLRAGTYTPLVKGETAVTYMDGTAAVAGKGVYTFKVSGASGSQITFKNYLRETVRINGGVHFTSGNCSYITIQGIEIAPTPTTRSFAAQANVDYPAIYITAAGIKIYDCYIHDCENIYPMEAAGFEMDGCVVGWNGFYSAALGYNAGYNLYAHNHGGGAVSIKNNVFLYSFQSTYASQAYNLHFYGTAADVRDYTLDHNVVMHGKILIGAPSYDNSGNVVTYNYVMGNRAAIQASIDTSNANPSAITLQHNTVWDAVGVYVLYCRGFKNVNLLSNLAVNNSGGSKEIGDYMPNNTPGTVIWNQNVYWGNPAGSAAFQYNGVASNYATWQASSGFDAATTHNSGLPTSNTVAAIPASTAGRGFVVAMNFLGASSVTVNLTPLGLENGATCRYYNCLNMSEYVEFTYDADSPNLTISLLAADWSLRSPTGYDSPIAWPSEPFPSYGVWLVEEVSTTMSNIEEGLYEYLTTKAEVYNRVETRIYPMTIPQEVSRPAAAYQVISQTEIMDHDGLSKLKTARVQLTCQGNTFEAAKELARMIGSAVRGYKGLMGDVTVESGEVLNEFDGWGAVGGVYTTRVDVGIMYRA